MQKIVICFWKKLAFGLAALSLAAVLPVWGQNLTKAEELYQRTDYEGSLALLEQNTSDGSTNFLIGRNYFMQGELKKATDFFLKATEEEPSNSEYMNWLGRAYGRRAETSNIMIAPGLASKARQAFERAVELNPKNSDALSDLFDYYLEAPGFMGGGYEKAMTVAAKTAAIDPPEGFYEKAKLAQKRKEYNAAETHLRQAVAAAPREVGTLISLAKFLANQGRNHESDEVFQQAEKINPNAPRVWFARADVLIKQKRDLAEAKALLEKYMHASVTPDDPPKQEALRLLKQAGGA
ncbi:MAG TPA: tetratricopeptide repeat protein [Bryobacteraceae bacterium]|nr:tetratricopeptide repeat protein [Bryobacteraceae bacterium]